MKKIDWHMLAATMALLLTTSVQAQSAPAATPGTATQEPALKHYRNFRDAPPADWRETNDKVARIGGWRAYAKESHAARAQDKAGPAK
ncbi:MAG: hypothetical protein QM776_00185 [Rhodocyclaceae bacterium]